ncbi:hypothetical protein [Rufibacter immobilis]|uniref:hypothetical protein n=1 Tax=Rufibacter immobilis TaxID=1348778 RepID=UPI00366A6819
MKTAQQNGRVSQILPSCFSSLQFALPASEAARFGSYFEKRAPKRLLSKMASF